MYNKKVHKCGLFISEEHLWLGGSPDGITDDDMLLECKWCISTALAVAGKAHPIDLERCCSSR